MQLIEFDFLFLTKHLQLKYIYTIVNPSYLGHTVTCEATLAYPFEKLFLHFLSSSILEQKASDIMVIFVPNFLYGVIKLYCPYSQLT